MLTAEQILASHKANIETLFGLSHTALEGFEKLLELNVQATKAALAEAGNHAQAVLNVKDVQELVTLYADVPPPTDKIAAYGAHISQIASDTGAVFRKTIEAQTAEAQKKVSSFVDSTTKNAGPGFENAAAMVKNTVDAATKAFDAMQKAVKQATDVAETNFNTAAVNATKTVAKKR